MYNKFHAKVKKLTGDKWCLYPNDCFMEAVLLTNDTEAKSLIEERRIFMFPVFMQGDPQTEKINEILNRK